MASSVILNPRDILFAKQLLFSLEQSGIIVFPDFNTGWHFDDKVGQKYLLETIDAPLVPSYVFYSKKEALEWDEQTNFPKVFKLEEVRICKCEIGQNQNLKLIKLLKKPLEKDLDNMNPGQI